MADNTTLSERFARTLEVLGKNNMSPPLREYIARTFPPTEDWLASAKTRLDRIFYGKSAGREPRETDSFIEHKLGIINPLDTDQSNAVSNSVLKVRAETCADNSKNNKGGIDATKASEEITANARNLGALTSPVASSVNGLVDEEKLAQQIHKVAETNTEGPVTAKATTAFDVTQENSAVEETVETVRMSAAEEHLQALQKMVIDTNGEDLDALMQYGNALHAKVYQDPKETGYKPPDAETIGQYANAINLIQKYQENANSRIMQPA